MMESLTVGDLSLEVRRSPRRQSLQITVDRKGEVIASAPAYCPPHKIEAFVREKRFWIHTKLAEKEAFPSNARTRQYVDGEGFHYLGRSYRLLLVDDQAQPVKLQQGRFKMSRAAAVEGRMHMLRWYTERARPWLEGRVARYQHRVQVGPAGLVVRELGFRWGSCGKGGRLYFHWRSILLPARVVEYIVVHELVHLVEPHHTPTFWRRVERVMPDFAVRKQWLAEKGGTVGL
jgi:predicted metal-dependent hydrolase